MRTAIKETTVYSFEDVRTNPELLKKVLEKYYYINVEHHNWYESTEEMFIEDTTDFNITKIYFSGFSSQGSGAMFEYNDIDSSKLLGEFIDTLNLSPMRKRWILDCVLVSAKGTQSGMYYHEKSCDHIIIVEKDFAYDKAPLFGEWLDNCLMDFEDFVIKKYETLCKGLYKTLDNEYDYLTSENAILETLESNDYEFTEDGEIYI